MNKQRKIRQEKGITLVALIITIIVLLILSVVAIRAVQGDGIIAHAQNARDNYVTAQGAENVMLQNYLNVLNEKTKTETDSSSKITWTRTSEGDLVVGSTIVTSTGENFYVIGFKGNNNETAILLAKDCIIVDEDDENYLKQSASAGKVAFCESSVAGYWGEGISPYDIKEETQPIPSTHTAAYAADRYGATLGVTGRLMYHSEAVALQSANSDILFGKNGKSSSTYLNYWLGSAYDPSDVWSVYGAVGYLNSIDCFGDVYGVRPVVEILKSNIS